MVKDSETVVLYITLVGAGCQNFTDTLHHRLPVQSGNVFNVHRGDLLLAGESNNKVPGFKGRLHSHLEVQAHGRVGGLW